MNVKALGLTPTRPENGETALAPHTKGPLDRLEQPFTWTRRLLSVRAPTIESMNYLVIRDDFGGCAGRTPFFQYWSLSEDATLAGPTARFKGQLGEDTDLVMLQPPDAELSKQSFTHNQCEPIVARLHQQKCGNPFEEKQVVCRARGKKGETHFVLLDTAEREVNTDGIKARTGALVCKTAGGKVASLTLMAGGTAEATGAKAVVAQPLPGLK